MAEEKPESPKTIMRHLGVLFLITAFIAAIVGLLLNIGTVIFFAIAGVFFILAIICLIISRRASDHS